ncbi:hypothetical protein AO1008_01360 [Aspergillus oryzae 100-8]|uniref:LysM domain-containing protein n=1 Tax=Aspergillus oryzae (strain 3.042) TaxID=1160506 RepID=I8TYI9_ASPO3|nr:hypothetical protein Ao3042_04050 [Aspergillus oryzae 3.042]KDE85770.1 hypothetical protein AO1008_01360 [Aspergillus oryzae 100-8]|eukprot:EIT79515.1 hypothetical protein Ao3042_04050 [Aspergillus oryzae 3.042]
MESDDSEIYADVPSNAAVNSTKQCYSWYDRTKEDSCDTILAYADIDMTAFYAWNSDCSNLWLNTSYCVSGPGFDDTYYPSISSSTSTLLPTATSTCASATVTAPGPTQTGIPCDCNKYAMHDKEVSPGVYCQDIATQNGITLEEFYEWNPALEGDCSGLWLNYAYCVGITSSTSPSNTMATTDAPTTTSSTPCATVKPPGPTQSGIPCTCNKYLMQADGVYCYDMATESDITLEELYKWNPALAGNCSGLWANYAYCVGVL